MDLDQAKAIFAASDVTTALVVDDVFDVFEPFEEDDLARAFDLIEQTDGVVNAFVEAGGAAPADPDALGQQLRQNPALLDVLSDARVGAAGPLQILGNAALGRIALDREGRLKPINDLVAVLKSLGVKTDQVGSDGPGGQDAARYPLIFMDYYLGSKGAPSVDRSRQRIEEIVSHYPPAEMPLVVLMSSELKKDKEAGKFRDKAHLLGSQFKFARKSEFEDDNMEFLTSLAGMVRFLPQTRTIGAFVRSWSGALGDALTDFKKGVGELDLQDYFQIRTKLGADGAGRFGDHVSGLFDGYLRRIIEDRPSLRSATAAMNTISFDGRPPTPFAPSETVVKMADAAAFQSLPETLPPTPGKLDLELGDVFLREMVVKSKRVKEACVVISQACDLEHGKTRTVLLLKGGVTKRSSAKANRAGSNRPIIRTDLFLHDGENLIIDWDASDLLTPPVDGFKAWAEQMAFEKVARLRPVHALALQQRFATHLTRVGLPETPPSYRYPTIEVVILRGTAKEQLFEPIKSGEFACVIGDEKPEAVIQEALLLRIKATLDGVEANGLDATELGNAKAVLGDWKQRQQLLGLRLEGGKAQVGNIAILDRESPLAAQDSLPKDAWLAINFYP